LPIEHICQEFRTTWLIADGKVICYPDHSFDLEPGIKFRQLMRTGGQIQVLLIDCTEVNYLGRLSGVGILDFYS
jgi:hypothetical protein